MGNFNVLTYIFYCFIISTYPLIFIEDMKKQMLFGSLTTLMLLAGVASAETINYNGMKVDVNANGEVSGYQVGDVKAEVTPTGVKMETSQGKANISVSADGKTMNVTSTSGGKTSSVNVVIDGRTVNMTSGDASLKVQLEKGLSSNGEAEVVDLKGNADLMIKSDDDLDAYNSLVVKTRPSVTSVSVDDDSVSVKYKQPAKFLGVFSSHINATAKVVAGGKVTIILPWYSFLYVKDSSTVESKIETSLAANNGGAQVDLSSIGTKGATNVEMNSSTDGTASLKIRNNAHAVNLISTAIDASVTAN
jgi:hypothetical protein